MDNGVCEACGSAERVVRLTLVMLKQRSRHSWDRSKFDCRLCRNCREKIFRERFNLPLAGIAGVACSLFPFLSMPWFVWLDIPVCVILGIMLLCVATLIRFIVGNAAPLRKMPAYLRLSTDGYFLGNSMVGKFIGMFLLAFGLMATAWFADASWKRSLQDGWSKVVGTVEDSQCRVYEEWTRHGGVTGCRIYVRFRYVYELNGNRYADVGYGEWRSDDRRMINHGWMNGAPVTVHCDPAEPGRSVVNKIDVSPFTTSVCVALCLAGLYLLVSTAKRWCGS